MRVAFLIHWTGFYGSNRSLVNLIDGLRDYGVMPDVVSPGEGHITKALQSRNVPITVLPLQWWMSPSRGRPDALRRLYHNSLLLPVLIRQLREWRTDVIYTNSSVLPIGAVLAKWMRLPHVWHLREIDDLDFELQHDWGAWTCRRVISWASAKIVVSEAVRSHVLDGVAPESVCVIYNGVASKADFDRMYERASAEPSPNRPYTFAIVGTIRRSKGQEVAIRVLAIVQDNFRRARLLVVGSGMKEYREKCQALARQLGVADRVEFWGYVEDPYKAYTSADATLMCSTYEGFGRTTVEAMSASRPVIGHDQGGTAEILKHEYTGLLYRGGPETLATCMMRFIDNPAWARQLGENGWHLARRKYTTEVYAQQVYDVLQSVVLAGGLKNR